MKFLALLLSAPLCASDALHVPLLCKYHQESHAVAGSLVGLGLSSFLKENTPLGPINRALIATGSALLFGYFKEHGMDHHSDNREVAPWGIGAAVACLGFEVRW